MKIAIATTGRFHVLDLARELHYLGEEISFHSFVPSKRSSLFGLPAQCARSLFPLLAPLIVWGRSAPRFLPELQARTMMRAIDAAVANRLERCDVLICMSGIFPRTAEVARKKFGACVVLERGSQHILAQQRILKQFGAHEVPRDFIVKRELEGYEFADRISVPSSAVVESFVSEAPHLVGKLVKNPYGVDLALFPQRSVIRRPGAKQVLFVGGWSIRKGADILVQAIQMMPDVQLIHVGKVLDLPFPNDNPKFKHVDSVQQWQLSQFYQNADVLVLPSREEGLALVQLQALASGLPIVCSDRTGGGDLALSLGLAERIFVVPPNDTFALSEALTKVLENHVQCLRPLADEDRQSLSWRAYAERYQRNLSAFV